jgi:hypothetical protein
VFVEHPVVHAQMRRQGLGAPGVARHVLAGGLAQEVAERIAESACSGAGLPARASAAERANSGTGTKARRIDCGSALIRATIFSSSRPGTSQSPRCTSTWLSAASGTIRVTPSSSAPGSKR